MKKVCARCGKVLLKLEDIAANYDNKWFACLPCWDKSEGFIGWIAEQLSFLQKVIDES